MAPKRPASSVIAEKTASAPTPSKRAKSRGRPVKLRKDEANDENVAPQRSPQPGPSSDTTNGSAVHKSSPKLKDLLPENIKFSYPFENLDLETTLDGTVNAVQKAVTEVLEDHNVRCTVPVLRMGEICKELEKNLSSRLLVDRTNANIPLLDAPLDEVMEETVEAQFKMNKSVFRQEIIKYILIASSQFDKLSTRTLLSIVKDLGASGLNLSEWENGYPAKIATKSHKYFDMTSSDFKQLDSQTQNRLNKEYCEGALRYYKDVENYLDMKHKKLKKESGGDGSWKNNPEGQKRELQLALTFQRNKGMGRHIKNEYFKLTNKEEHRWNPLMAEFRSVLLRGKIGVRTEKEESELEGRFQKTDLEVLKAFSDHCTIIRGEEVIDNDITADIGNSVPFVPTPVIHRDNIV